MPTRARITARISSVAPWKNDDGSCSGTCGNDGSSHWSKKSSPSNGMLMKPMRAASAASTRIGPVIVPGDSCGGLRVCRVLHRLP